MFILDLNKKHSGVVCVYSTAPGELIHKTYNETCLSLPEAAAHPIKAMRIQRRALVIDSLRESQEGFLPRQELRYEGIIESL